MRKSLAALRRLKGGVWVAVMIGCLLMSAGCSAQAKKDRHLSRAGRYAQGEKYREAAIEYLNVLKGDPTNRVAVRGMGLTLYQMGEVRGAMYYLQKAEELDPADGEVRLKLGALFLVMGDRPHARQRAEAVLKGAPDNLDALVLWGAGVSTSNEAVAAISRLSSVRERFGDQPKFLVTLASLSLGIGDFAAAEAVYTNALSQLPKAWEIHLALGDLYLRQRQTARAGEAYRQAADYAPLKSPARVKLAKFLWGEGKRAEATNMLDDLLKQAPGFSAASLCRAEIALSERDYDTATRILEKLTVTEPSNLEAFLLMQRVKLAQGRDDEAIAAYTKLTSAFPKAAQARYLLSAAWLHKGDVQKAIGESERAVALDPNHVESIRLLAELYIRTGKPDRALALLTPLVRRYPGEGFVYVLIGAAHSAKKDFDLAANTYRDLMRKLPDNDQGPYLLGLVLRRMGRDEEAVQMFEEALRLDPRSLEALEQVAWTLAGRKKKWELAVDRIERQIEKAPLEAGFYYLLGTALSRKQEWDPAEKAFLKAIELKPDTTAAYLGLSYLYVVLHKEDQALGKLDRALQVNSNDVASLMMKGTILLNRKDFANAAIQYERILGVNPNFVPVLNNLACHYQGTPALKEKAYEYARRARELAPQDPRVADTLGWILFLRGDFQWALTLLQESAERLPGEAEVLYHLGMCQAALGDSEKARTSLTRALELSKTFGGAAEAVEMVAVLAAGEDLKELATVGQAESFLAKYPDNPVALVKAGAFYEKTGDYEHARDLYEKALVKNGHFVPGLTRLARLLADHFDQLDRALVLARQAREGAPADGTVADTLALLAFRKGDYKWAQSLLMESSSRAGVTPERQYLLGLVYYALGKVDAATNLICQVQDPAVPAKKFMENVSRPAQVMAYTAEPDLRRPLTVEALPLVMYLAGTYEQKGEKDRARALYQKITAQYPDFGPAFGRLALLLMGQKTLSEEEFKTIVKARELLPGDPNVGRALGVAAYKKGQYEWASRLLQEVSVTATDPAEVYYYLGMSYHQLKNKPAAKKALERALELDPQSEWAAVAKGLLNPLK